LPFEIDKVVNDYNTNLLLVSPPGVDCIEERAILDDNLYKVDENQWPILEYRKSNRLGSYINRYESAMEYISNKLPNSNFFVFGHSQGSRIAAVLGGRRSDIRKIALASVNPISRSYETISRLRIQYLKGEINFDDAQALIEQEYTRVRLLQEGNNKNLEELSELSFTYPSLLTSMLKLDQPLRFIYGTHDFGTSIEADKIMLEFIYNKKSNLSTKVFKEMDHNLFESDVWGWDLFFNDTMKWFEKD
jgi:pimeloyl-ACP methyl ester carboxylesterase